MYCSTCEYKEIESDVYYETDHWKVVLIDNQGYIGHSIVVLKDHKSTLSDLSEEEWKDFIEVQKKIENAIKKAFNSPLLNWGCMMNDAFKENGNTHVHWHVLARTKEPVIIDGVEFIDPNFAHHYDNHHYKKADVEMRKKIIEKIKEKM